FGREVPEAGQLPELCEGLAGWYGAEAGGIQPAVQRGARKGAKPFGFAAGQPGKRAELSQALGRGKGVHDAGTERDRLANLLCDARLDRCGLPDPDALSDDSPGGSLVWRPEADRPEARIAVLQPGNHRIALTDGGKPGPVYIQGQDPRNLHAD